MARGIFVGLFFIHAQRGGVDTEAFAAMFGWAVVEDKMCIRDSFYTFRDNEFERTE